MLRVLFIDVGGTLWPNQWRSLPGDHELRTARLRAGIPALTHEQAAAIEEVLSTLDHPPGERQATDVLVGAACRAVAPGVEAPVPAVVAAMCLPASGRAVPFAGAGELLASLSEKVRIVIVSNVLWRDAGAQRQDFLDLGLAPFVSGYVTSLDVGWRKPNAAFFDTALAAGGHAPRDCALVGDSEENDIAPALALGMFAARVALEEPPPSSSAANLVTDSLYAVRDALLQRVTEGR